MGVGRAADRLWEMCSTLLPDRNQLWEGCGRAGTVRVGFIGSQQILYV